MKRSDPFGDTIIAVASASGRGALCLFRISGEACLSFLTELAGKPCGYWRDHPRLQTLCHLRDGEGQSVDQGLVTFFPGPRSYTGEDVAEVSCHSGPWIRRTILQTALDFGLRLAQPGEFTRRAFLQGKIDLLQAEGVRDLVEAETSFQARLARQQAEGVLSRRLQPIRSGIITTLSQLETRLEFVEDEVSPQSREDLIRRLEEVEGTLQEMEATARLGCLVQEGAQVVLTGAPNVGKSSIFNRLLGDDRAIVAEIPGTTRDVIRERVELDGILIELVDTAGIRKTEDRVEALGVDRSRRSIGDSDLVLFVVDRSAGFGEADWETWNAVKGFHPLLVVNKGDLPGVGALPAEVQAACGDGLVVSAQVGTGITALGGAIRSRLVGYEAEAGEGALLTSLRQRKLVAESRESVARSAAVLRDGLSEEFAVYELKRGLESLGCLTGEITLEEILGEIFSTFCIGK